MQERSKKLQAELFGRGVSGFGAAAAAVSGPTRQTGEGQAIINAKSSRDQGVALSGVTVFTFDTDGRFQRRIEARAAVLDPGVWKLLDARVYRLGQRPIDEKVFGLKTSLTPEQVRESFATPETVPFWDLPLYIKIAEHAGLVAAGYRLQFQKLLARPFMLAAMVFLAAAVSLRFFRFGGVQKMVLSGVASRVSALCSIESDGRFEQGRADAPSDSSLAACARRWSDGVHCVVVPGGRVMAGPPSAPPPAARPRRGVAQIFAALVLAACGGLLVCAPAHAQISRPFRRRRCEDPGRHRARRSEADADAGGQDQLRLRQSLGVRASATCRSTTTARPWRPTGSSTTSRPSACTRKAMCG